jgi:predicted dehydrogenase
MDSPGYPSAPQSARAAALIDSTEPLRVGILGAARISENAIVTPARLVGTRLVAVAARDRSRAQAFADAHGVERVLGTYADVLTDPEVEAIYNPLANGLHGPWNLAAIAAGKHVLSEKPFASNAAEAVEVRDAGKRAGVVVAEGFHYLYHPVTRRLHELVASGELGEIEQVEVTMTNPAPEPEDPRWSLELAGGALMDLGCYSLHAHRVLAPWTGGAPVIVGVHGGERKGLPGVDEWADVDLVFPSGARGLARCNMAGDQQQLTYRIQGSRGEATVANFILPHVDDRLLVRIDGVERVEHLGTRSSYTYQLEAFTAAVRHGVPMPTDSDDAVVTMRMVDACYGALGLAPRPRSPLVA